MCETCSLPLHADVPSMPDLVFLRDANGRMLFDYTGRVILVPRYKVQVVKQEALAAEESAAGTYVTGKLTQSEQPAPQVEVAGTQSAQPAVPFVQLDFTGKVIKPSSCLAPVKAELASLASPSTFPRLHGAPSDPQSLPEQMTAPHVGKINNPSSSASVKATPSTAPSTPVSPAPSDPQSLPKPEL